MFSGGKYEAWETTSSESALTFLDERQSGVEKFRTLRNLVYLTFSFHLFFEKKELEQRLGHPSMPLSHDTHQIELQESQCCSSGKTHLAGHGDIHF